jgi:DegV family protein with EDD domain
VFSLETLEYLAHGGRIGRVQAIAGALLHIKPVIHVDHDDGRYTTVAKARTFSKALASIADFLAARYGAEPLWVIVQHGQREQGARAFADDLHSTLAISRLEYARVSPILGVHTGPGIIGACAVPARHVADLLP